jgi:hypothetical protein
MSDLQDERYGEFLIYNTPDVEAVYEAILDEEATEYLTVQTEGVVKECLTTEFKENTNSLKHENPIAWLEPGATGNNVTQIYK